MCVLVEVEFVVCDVFNVVIWFKVVGFFVLKILEFFDVVVFLIFGVMLDYLVILEFVCIVFNLVLVGLVGIGKIYILIVLGYVVVSVGLKVKYVIVVEIVEIFYCVLVDNFVGCIIDILLCNDLIIFDEIGFVFLDDIGI